MIAQAGQGIDPTVLVALIGLPAALITAIGTVWVVSKKGGPSASSLPVVPETSANGQRFVSHHELREVVRDIREEMRAMEERQNSKLDLIVALLKRNGA